MCEQFTPSIHEGLCSWMMYILGVHCSHTYLRDIIHRYLRTNMQIYIHTHIHTFTHTHIHTYTHTHVHTQIHTYIHTYIHTCIHTSKQPIAFEVSFNLNLQALSHWYLFHRPWQKRPRELDRQLRFGIEEMTLRMQ